MSNKKRKVTIKKECTEKQWEEEMRLNKFCGRHPNWFHSGCSLRCPHCQSVGFYGPKLSKNNAGEITRKYRACKFCGFWQEVWGSVRNERGGKPYRCIAIYCDKCQAYDWQVPWSQGLKRCPNCHTEMRRIKWAIDDPNHHFHKLKEQMDKIHQDLNFPYFDTS